ncbi:MAG: phosphotransferase [Steroidobacteraceae bacterium]|nr:phosphotransferase [Steroidobacteraceae bacterium]
MTSAADRAAARAAIATVPALSRLDAAALDIVRLGGLTNQVFSVRAGAEAYCLRVPGKGTDAYIDRRVEAVNARAAAAAGVGPEVLYFGDHGIMVTRFLAGCVTMTPETLRTTPGAPVRAARAFRQLHLSGRVFAFRFELFAMIDGYLAHLETLGASLPEDYHETVASARIVREALAARPLPLAPCHCDPLCENLLDDGRRMWLVDWEYSGMNDPMWDLGDLSVEAGFGPEHDRAMLEAYFDGPARPADLGRMVIYKAMCDLLWTLWGLIQHANRNPADDFWSYAVKRFARCRGLMATPAFAAHLAAIRSAE